MNTYCLEIVREKTFIMEFLYKIFRKILPNRSAKIVPTSICVDGPQKECSICMESADPYYCTTNCGHHYHTQCLKTSLDYCKNCPLCREKIENYICGKRTIRVSPLVETNNVERNNFRQSLEQLGDTYNLSGFTGLMEHILSPHKYLYWIYKNSPFVRWTTNLILFVVSVGILYIYFVVLIVYFIVYSILHCCATIIDFIYEIYHNK